MRGSDGGGGGVGGGGGKVGAGRRQSRLFLRPLNRLSILACVLRSHTRFLFFCLSFSVFPFFFLFSLLFFSFLLATCIISYLRGWIAWG